MSGAAPPPAPPTLELRVRHAWGERFQLDVDLVTRARSLALFGPSGAGKSSLLDVVSGALRPRSGRVRVAGRALLDTAAGVDLPPRRRRVAHVVQDGLLFPLLTVRENLLFGAPRRGARLSLERVAALLEVEGLLDRWPRTLSGGERQRVALGRALLSEPELLLCDEPFAALDAPRRDRLLGLLARVRDELDVPLVLVTHAATEVLALAEDVVVLDAGRVRCQGPPGAVLREVADEATSPLNYWEGVVEDGPDAPPLAAVRVGAHLLHAPVGGAAPGARVRLALAPQHVALARPGPGDGSPRNHLEGRVVAAVEERGGLVRVTIDTGSEAGAGLSVAALVSREAATELGLTVGARAAARFKATAVQVLAVLGARG